MATILSLHDLPVGQFIYLNQRSKVCLAVSYWGQSLKDPLYPLMLLDTFVHLMV